MAPPTRRSRRTRSKTSKPAPSKTDEEPEEEEQQQQQQQDEDEDQQEDVEDQDLEPAPSKRSQDPPAPPPKPGSTSRRSKRTRKPSSRSKASSSSAARRKQAQRTPNTSDDQLSKGDENASSGPSDDDQPMQPSLSSSTATTRRRRTKNRKVAQSKSDDDEAKDQQESGHESTTDLKSLPSSDAEDNNENDNNNNDNDDDDDDANEDDAGDDDEGNDEGGEEDDDDNDSSDNEPLSAKIKRMRQALETEQKLQRRKRKSSERTDTSEGDDQSEEEPIKKPLVAIEVAHDMDGDDNDNVALNTKVQARRTNKSRTRRTRSSRRGAATKGASGNEGDTEEPTRKRKRGRAAVNKKGTQSSDRSNPTSTNEDDSSDESDKDQTKKVVRKKKSGTPVPSNDANPIEEEGGTVGEAIADDEKEIEDGTATDTNATSKKQKRKLSDGDKSVQASPSGHENEVDEEETPNGPIPAQNPKSAPDGDTSGDEKITDMVASRRARRSGRKRTKPQKYGDSDIESDRNGSIVEQTKEPDNESTPENEKDSDTPVADASNSAAKESSETPVNDAASDKVAAVDMDDESDPSGGATNVQSSLNEQAHDAANEASLEEDQIEKGRVQKRKRNAVQPESKDELEDKVDEDAQVAKRNRESSSREEQGGDNAVHLADPPQSASEDPCDKNKSSDADLIDNMGERLDDKKGDEEDLSANHDVTDTKSLELDQVSNGMDKHGVAKEETTLVQDPTPEKEQVVEPKFSDSTLEDVGENAAKATPVKVSEDTPMQDRIDTESDLHPSKKNASSSNGLSSEASQIERKDSLSTTNLEHTMSHGNTATEDNKTEANDKDSKAQIPSVEEAKLISADVAINDMVYKSAEPIKGSQGEVKQLQDADQGSEDIAGTSKGSVETNENNLPMDTDSGVHKAPDTPSEGEMDSHKSPKPQSAETPTHTSNSQGSPARSHDTDQRTAKPATQAGGRQDMVGDDSPSSKDTPVLPDETRDPIKPEGDPPEIKESQREAEHDFIPVNDAGEKHSQNIHDNRTSTDSKSQASEDVSDNQQSEKSEVTAEHPVAMKATGRKEDSSNNSELPKKTESESESPSTGVTIAHTALNSSSPSLEKTPSAAKSTDQTIERPLDPALDDPITLNANRAEKEVVSGSSTVRSTDQDVFQEAASHLIDESETNTEEFHDAHMELPSEAPAPQSESSNLPSAPDELETITSTTAEKPPSPQEKEFPSPIVAENQIQDKCKTPQQNEDSQQKELQSAGPSFAKEGETDNTPMVQTPASDSRKEQDGSLVKTDDVKNTAVPSIEDSTPNDKLEQNEVEHQEDEPLHHSSPLVLPLHFDLDYVVSFGQKVNEPAPSSTMPALHENDNSLTRAKTLLYVTGSKVHRGRGFERIFAEYWDAMSLRLSDRLSRHTSERCDRAINTFLKTRQLRKIHNKLVLSVMKQAITGKGSLDTLDNHIPLKWRHRVGRGAKQSVSKLDNAVTSGSLPTKKVVAFSEPMAYRELWDPDEHDLEPLGNERRRQKTVVAPTPASASSFIPGALVIDPLVRKLTGENGMQPSELAVWLLVVAVKEHTSSLLKATISQKEAAEKGEVAERICTFPKVLATPNRMPSPKYNLHDSSTGRSSSGTKRQKKLTALDVYSGSSLLSTGPSGALGGSISRNSLERCLHASYEHLPALPRHDFVQVQQYMMDQITAESRARNSIPRPQEANVPRPQEENNTPTGDPTSQAENTSFTVPPPAPSQKVEPVVPSEEVNPSTSMAAKGGPSTPTMSEESKLNIRGLGRGAKNLAALMKRASSTPAPTESETPIPKGKEEKEAISVSVPAKEKEEGNITAVGSKMNGPVDESKSETESDGGAGAQRRGKGFGIKTLAAMRARVTTKEASDIDGNVGGNDGGQPTNTARAPVS